MDADDPVRGPERPPADADAVPPAAFTSEAGGALYAADPTQSRRARIAAYRNVFTAYQAH